MSESYDGIVIDQDALNLRFVQLASIDFVPFSRTDRI